MTDAAPTSLPPPNVTGAYLAMVRTRRLWTTTGLLIYALLFLGGFWIANDRNAGGFWRGLPQIFDFPADVVSEAAENAAKLRDEDYQLAYAIDILKGFLALGTESRGGDQ